MTGMQGQLHKVMARKVACVVGGKNKRSQRRYPNVTTWAISLNWSPLFPFDYRFQSI